MSAHSMRDHSAPPWQLVKPRNEPFTGIVVGLYLSAMFVLVVLAIVGWLR